MDPCFEWWCYLGFLGCLLGVVEFEDEFFLRGVECNIPKKCWPKVDLRCEDVEKGCGLLDAKLEVIWGVVSFLPQKNPMWSPPFSPLPSRPPLPLLGHPSPPHCSRPLPSPLLPPLSKSPPRSKDREGKEQVGLKRKRGQRRCSIPISSCRFSWGNPR
jgi:hypothetical protein